MSDPGKRSSMRDTESRRQKHLDNPYYDDDVLYPDLLSSISSSASCPDSRLQRGCFESDTDELIAGLTHLGFDAALNFVQQYGTQRVRAALERALSQPRGTIRNLPGYIRYLVASPGPISRPKPQAQPNDKYISGRYGHVVQR